MTDKEINEAIAVSLGWTHIENANTMAVGGIWVGYPPTQPIIGRKKHIPSYTTDLNACAEMEKTLTDEEKVKYIEELHKLVAGYNLTFATITASPAQRCEAFLRVRNLWPSVSEGEEDTP